jgi:hypothetical protein
VTQLHQLLAVETGAKKTADTALTGAYHAIQRTAQLSGLTRTYTPRDEEGERLPDESTLVQVKVGDIVDLLGPALTRWLDVTFTKDATNTTASADVVLEDGTVLLEDVPATYLLWLEKRVEDLSTLVGKLPTLDPAKNWAYDANAGAYRAEPEQTTRTKKVLRNHVKAEATDKHPAQVEVYTEDVIIGTWTKTEFSGAIPADRKAVLVDRVARLADAVKMAREKANTQEVTDRKAGAAILDYVFA